MNDFKNLKAAADWLRDNGYKVGKTKVYDDAKAGLLPVRDDGTVSARDVAAYAATLRRKNAPRADVVEDLAERKLRAEIRKTEEQAKKISHDRAIAEGKYIPKTEAELARVDILVLLDSNLRAMMDRRIPHYIRLCGGNSDALQELRRVVSEDIDDLFDSLARSEVFVVAYEEPAPTVEPIEPDPIEGD